MSNDNASQNDPATDWVVYDQATKETRPVTLDELYDVGEKGKATQPQGFTAADSQAYEAHKVRVASLPSEAAKAPIAAPPAAAATAAKLAQ